MPKRKNNSGPVISQRFQSISIQFVILIRLVCIINLILNLSCPFVIQRRKSYLFDFIKKNVNVGLYSDIYTLISFKLGIHFAIALNDLDFHSRSMFCDI